MKLFDARQAIHDAYALHLLSNGENTLQLYGCRIDKSTACTADSVIVDAIEAGRIMEAIDEQPQYIKDWLLKAYPPDSLMLQSVFLQSHLFDKLFSRVKDNKKSRLHKLCGLAIVDYKMRVNNGNKLTVEFISSVIGMPRQNLKRDGYLSKFREIENMLAEYDAVGLAVVANVLRGLRGNRENK